MLTRPFRRSVHVAILGDLHLETGPWPCDPPRADLVLLAGDIHAGAAGVPWAANAFRAPVAYVAGNHEFYDAEILEVMAALQAATLRTGAVTFLERETSKFRFPSRYPLERDAAVRVLGAVLWTDFMLGGDPDSGRAAAASLGDYRRIRLDGRPFSPEDAARWHAESVAWLDRTLAEPFDGATVVLTHHAPSLRSLPRRLAEQPIGGGFASDLEALILRHEPALWVHGHTHHDVDYRIGRTRVVSRQRGPAHEGKSVHAAIVKL